MSWLLIFLLLIVIGMAVAIILIKRQQNAPFKNFAETVTTVEQALRRKPQSVNFIPTLSATKHTPADPDSAGFGEYEIHYEGIDLRYQHERSTEFLDLTGEDITPVGIQYIDGDPKEIYLENVRIMELNRFLEQHTGEMLSIRRLIRKHLKLQK